MKESTPLADEVARFGTDAFVISVTPDAKPHIGPVQPSLVDGVLVLTLLPGSRAERNALVNPTLCLHWPGRADTDGYSLIVDGDAAVHAGEHDTVVRVTPTKAVLHKLGTPGANTNACNHDCRSVSLD